jgi:hypothetical protein
MSFFRGFGKVIFYSGLFVAGYAIHGCVNDDIRYDVRRYDKNPFLVDKKLGHRVEIVDDNGKTQLGDLEYRVECILENPRLKEALDGLKNKWGRK